MIPEQSSSFLGRMFDSLRGRPTVAPVGGAQLQPDAMVAALRGRPPDAARAGQVGEAMRTYQAQRPVQPKEFSQTYTPMESPPAEQPNLTPAIPISDYREDTGETGYSGPGGQTTWLSESGAGQAQARGLLHPDGQVDINPDGSVARAGPSPGRSSALVAALRAWLPRGG